MLRRLADRLTSGAGVVTVIEWGRRGVNCDRGRSWRSSRKLRMSTSGRGRYGGLDVSGWRELAENELLGVVLMRMLVRLRS